MAETISARVLHEIEPVSPALVAAVTGRTTSLFATDMAANQDRIAAEFGGARVLVVGAAGSIGGAFVRLLSAFAPAGLFLLDIDENGLADLVRDLRSSGSPLPRHFSTAVVALESPAMERLLGQAGRFDIVMNFAAMKHVRSERDPYSLTRMIETNVLAVGRLRRLLHGRATRLFSVSSDKAVHPTSLMGATKRWMERILASPSGSPICTSARFANVAFSKGSLPHAFLARLEKRQPFAAPSDVRRFFISHTEAAELCLLATILGQAREILVPKLDPEANALTLEEVARRVLAHHGFAPAPCASEDEAQRAVIADKATTAAWPCYFAPADTMGEKDIEELVYPDEDQDRSRLAGAVIVRQTVPDEEALAAAADAVAAALDGPSWRKEPLIAAIRRAVPELRHNEQFRSLDDKM